MVLRRLAFVLLLLAPALAAAEEQAFTNRPTELKESANPDSRTLASLPVDASVKVVARGGGWTRVDASGRQGWVRVFHLRFPVTAEASSSGGIGSAFGSLFGNRPTSRQATIATTGIRGLSTEDLKNANPDPEALRRMQSYRSDKPGAERFAREGKLAEVRVDDDGGRR